MTIDVYRDAYAGSACIISGNGPSLAGVPDAFLSSLPTFGTNRVYRKYEPTYYVCTDPLDVKKNMDYITARRGPKFIQSSFGIEYGLEIIYKPSVPGWNRFTPDPTHLMYDGATVTFVCLELAYWMGFATVYLVGVDHRYEWRGDRLNGNNVVTFVSDGKPDPNHFCPDYLEPGEKWQPPNLERMTSAYRLAHEAYKRDGRRIVNLTPNTALEVFERKELVYADR